MEVKRLELLDKLNSAKAGVASSAHLEQMMNVQFTGNDIVSFNEEICVHIPFETDFVASVNYNDLHSIISKTSSDEIIISVDNSELLISSSDTKAGLIMMDTEVIDNKIEEVTKQLPEDESGWKKLPKNFIDGITLCTPAADKNPAKQALNCLYTNGKQIICSDNKRVAIYELDSDLGESFLIRSGLVSELTRFNVIDFAISEAWIHFVTKDDIIFSVRSVIGQSLDFCLRVLDDFEGKKGTRLPDGLRHVISSASVMAGSSDKKEMDIFIKDDQMVCSTSNERGWVEKSIKMKDKNKKAIEMKVSPDFLQQVVDLPDLTMCVGDGKSLFESGSFKYVLIHYYEE